MLKTFEKFTGQAQYITLNAWEAIVARLQGHEVDPEKRPTAARPTEDYFGDPIAGLEMAGPVGIVTVSGPMLKGATPFDQWYGGFAAHENIAADLRGAVAAGAEVICMRMNSPGGSVTGTPELAELVANIVKGGTQVVSYTEDQKCSAAEYITGACTVRLATGSSVVGSIGTMLETVSLAKFLERVGVSYNIFTSGKYKAMGHPAKDLTPEQAAFLQDFVSNRAAEFKQFMSSNRPGIKPDAMQGQIFSGKEAAQNGLVDAIVSGWEEALAFATHLAS